MVETPEPAEVRGSSEIQGPFPARRKRRRWLALIVVPVCAVAPWLVPWPWQGVDEVATSNPSSIIERVQAERPTSKPGAAQRQAPNANSVKALTQEVAASGGSYDLPVSADVAGVKTTPGAYQKVGQIKIPSVGLDVSYGEGVYAKALEVGPGHWPGTPMPGQAGNSVLSGHRNTHTQPFKELDRLKPGDKIIVSVGKGAPVTFKVDNTTIVPESTYKDFVLRQPKDPKARQLTVFACHPEGNPIFRIVVRATASS